MRSRREASDVDPSAPLAPWASAVNTIITAAYSGTSINTTAAAKQAR